MSPCNNNILLLFWIENTLDSVLTHEDVIETFKWTLRNYFVRFLSQFTTTLHSNYWPIIDVFLLIVLQRHLFGISRRGWRYKKGNQNPYIVEEQTTQWLKETWQKDKQRSTKHTYKTKDRVTRTPLKTVFMTRTSFQAILYFDYKTSLGYMGILVVIKIATQKQW